MNPQEAFRNTGLTNPTADLTKCRACCTVHTGSICFECYRPKHQGDCTPLYEDHCPGAAWTMINDLIPAWLLFLCQE
ncbi:hypothetical protein [Niabella terrae]